MVKHLSRSNNDGFVQFWDRAFNIFFCAYSGRREINSLVQFWDGVYNYAAIKYIEVG